MAALLAFSDGIDIAFHRDELARTGRTQVRDVLTTDSARRLRALLDATPWGLVWRGKGQLTPDLIRAERLGTIDAARARAIQQALLAAMAGGDYAFCYSTYPLVQALLEGWNPGGPHEQLLIDLNNHEVLDLVRAISGIPDIVKADGQATLYRPGHFLARHDDAEPDRGRRIAYVLSLSGDPGGAPWRPEWGGMLQFLDDDGSPRDTILPRFNALNLFTVPQPHHVTSVASFAPATRFAVTGWFRDRI